MSSSTSRYMHPIHVPLQKHESTRTAIPILLDIDLFSRELLSREQGLHAAIRELDNYLFRSELEPLKYMIDVLKVGPPNLLEYIIAVALDENRYEHLVSTLWHTFPSSADAFTTSLARELIERLQVFYIHLITLDLPRSLDDCHRRYQVGAKALDAICGLKFSKSSPASGTSPINPRTPVVGGLGSRQSQRKNKQARRQSCAKILTDSAPFAAIRRNVPGTEEEAAELATELLADQKKILEEYLTVLRSPGLAPDFEKLYLVTQSCPEPLGRKATTDTTGTADNEPIQETEVHPAYPYLQPMKAAKYFSEPAEGFGPWNLLLSGRAIQHLKSYHRDQKVWATIKKKMQDLSQGHFSTSNQKRLVGTVSEVPIYEAKLSRDLRIVYQIDIAPDDETRNDHQVIKVWGIHTHAQMDQRLWKSISRHQTSIGGEYRRRCLYREIPKANGKDIILPYSWHTAVTRLPEESTVDTSLTIEEQLELHSILALEKFTRMSQALLNNIITEQDVAHPFELSGAEQEVRDHNSSCFVLGRSGTGKTTTMVFKMMNYEMLRDRQAAQEADAFLTQRPRQLFVTQSRVLAGRVQEYFGKMILSHRTGHNFPQELELLARNSRQVEDREGMPDLEDEKDEERTDLPKKFSELEDIHFPLFLTVDQLCKLLEADCNLSFKRRPRTIEHRRVEQRSHSVKVDGDMTLAEDDDSLGTDVVTASPTSEERTSKASIVTFDVFRYAYWPRFPQPLIKGFDPGLVYNEFLGVIKGSEATLEAENNNGFLEREVYTTLSERTQATFAKQRDRIYDLFERYTKMKGERGDYDAADRTHAIIRALEKDIPFKRKVDHLYIDEAQDNLIIDAKLLKLVCGNPHGLFWAGDTAQTISMGSSFRFDDLKSFIYRIEEKSSRGRTPVHPASFQLDVNYRSHAGVVDCAHSVVELITNFWPNSIDALARERGLVDGPRPIFFSGWNAEDASYEQFFFHESLNIELGAQQCILVRNDQAREALRRQIGEVGLVMTLYEAKGLEFNDVLIYNFFADSTAALPEWRVVLNMIEETQRDHISPPRFDEARHASLCSELKCLYVGITRARSHVWILDTSETGGPMRLYWKSRQLIQICRPGDPIPQLAVKSTPEKWSQQGHVLFKARHFKHAMLCFERASLLLERSIAYAHLLREMAKRLELQHGFNLATKNAYVQAAEAFVVCTGLSTSKGKKSRYLTSAANCYSSGGRASQAAQAYLNSGGFTQAARHFKGAGLFDEAADVVLLHRDEVDPGVAQYCLDIAKLHLHREGQLQKAARLFNDIEEQLSHLADYGLDYAKLALLERLERWADAAEFHYQEGQNLEAIQLWLRAGDSESRRRASHCLIDALWKHFPLGESPSQESSQRMLLGHLRTLADDLGNRHHDESAVFSAILERNETKLLQLASAFSQAPGLDPMVHLLCLDHALAKPPCIQNDSAQIVSRHLENYDIYAQLMRSVTINWRKARAIKLLGLVEIVEDLTPKVAPEFRVLPTSILFKQLRTEGEIGEHITVRSDRVSAVVPKVLGTRMAERLQDQNTVCLHTRAFRLCVNFAVNGTCTRANCFREHLSRESHDLEVFNLRIRLHMQQIVIVHNLAFSSLNRRRVQQIWLERLYEALFPVYYALGHASALVADYIPEYQRASRVLSEWTQDQFNRLTPYHSFQEGRFLTAVTQTATLAFVFDRDNATHYIRRAPCVIKHGPSYLLRREGYVVHDLLNFLAALSKSSITEGALFIKHVLDQRIPIDIDALLNLIESVFGQAIVASCRPLNNLTLPRSWIVSSLSLQNESRASHSVTNLTILIDPLKKLLEAMLSNQDVAHFTYTYDRCPLSLVPVHATGRSVLVLRICRCITLLGYNGRSQSLRYMIQRMMASLNKPNYFLASLFKQYITARHWQDLSRAVCMTDESPLDELVVLSKDVTASAVYRPPRNVKIIWYEDELDIHNILAYKVLKKFNPKAAPFIPQAVLQQVVTPDPEPEEPEDEVLVDETFNNTIPDIEVAPNDISIQRTNEEIDAARAVQIWYLCRRSAIQQRSNTGSSAQIRSRTYATSQMEINKLRALVPSRYQCMFLGPLPHVLTALHGCGRAIKKAKDKSKRRLQEAKYVNYDEVSQLITDCNRLQKNCIRLGKIVEPASDFHRQGSCLELKRRVEEISVLFEDVQNLLPNIAEFAWDMEVGYKGIVVPPRPTAKHTKRPSLNTEDLLMI